MFAPTFCFRTATSLAATAGLSMLVARADSADSLWKKHVVHQGAQSLTAIAGDFTKDGRPDIIANSDEKTRLFVGPDWKEIVIDATRGHDFIHAETIDIDSDRDLDFIGARYQPGLIIWLEPPANPLTDPWPLRIISQDLNGLHRRLTVHVDKI